MCVTFKILRINFTFVMNFPFLNLQEKLKEKMQRERKIDVTPSNYSVLDTEFGNMRERFEAEMRHVEEEMKRLRREFEGIRFFFSYLNEENIEYGVLNIITEIAVLITLKFLNPTFISSKSQNQSIISNSVQKKKKKTNRKSQKGMNSFNLISYDFISQKFTMTVF